MCSGLGEKRRDGAESDSLLPVRGRRVPQTVSGYLGRVPEPREVIGGLSRSPFTRENSLGKSPTVLT
jgi:hypothetical protein